jgi:hypothetical protein
MSTTGFNITKYIPTIKGFKPVNVGKPATTNIFGTEPKVPSMIGAEKPVVFGSLMGNASPVKKWIAYLLAIFIVIMAILILIHYTITPIFRTNPGSPGIITVPGVDDGKLYWQKDSSVLHDNNTVLGSNALNYTILMDIYISNPLSFKPSPRLLFFRGGQNAPAPNPNAQTILGVVENYNIAVALSPDTNDLIVSTLTAGPNGQNMENILVPNVPVQEPFRLGIVMMDVAMEVYMNGRLVKSRALSGPPKAINGSFYPMNKDIGTIRNLHLWKRVLSPPEIRYATPSLPEPKLFNPTPMPSSSSSKCDTSNGPQQQPGTTLSIKKMT